MVDKQKKKLNLSFHTVWCNNKKPKAKRVNPSITTIHPLEMSGRVTKECIKVEIMSLIILRMSHFTRRKGTLRSDQDI